MKESIQMLEACVRELTGQMQDLLQFVPMLIIMQAATKYFDGSASASPKLYKRTLPVIEWVPYYMKMYSKEVIDRTGLTPVDDYVFFVENRNEGRSFANKVRLLHSY
jgi:hypothetical protein